MDKITSLKKIFYLILLSLIIYSVYWLYASFKFKEEINSIINNNNIITEEIRITGFPYRLESHIKNLSFEKNEQSFFLLTVPELKISVSPISFKKIFVQSNSSELRFKDITHKINIINKQSRLSILTKDGFIERLAFILEGNDVYYKNLIFGEFNKSFSNIIIDGKINYIKKNIEGKFQLSIYDDEGQKKFSSPISINNNKLKILFFELDFSKLF